MPSNDKGGGEQKPIIKMKIKASILTSIACGVMLAGGLVACNKSKTDDKAAAVAPASNKDVIAYINTDTLLAKYDYAKDLNKTLTDKGKSAQNDLGGRQQAFQREYADYQKNINTMSADQRQSTEDRLRRENQDLQSYQQNAGAQFQTEQASDANKVYDKIAGFSKALAKEKGYKLVLSYSKNGGSGVIYGDSSLDVTGELLKRLNDAYAKDKK